MTSGYTDSDFCWHAFGKPGRHKAKCINPRMKECSPSWFRFSGILVQLLEFGRSGFRGRGLFGSAVLSHEHRLPIPEVIPVEDGDETGGIGP